MKCLQVGVFAICAAAVQTYAALPLDGVVPPYVYSEVSVTGQTTVTGLAVSGTLEKRGSGELTLTDLLSLPGTVLVREGSVTLAESGFSAALPTALQRGLAFWVDANTNLVLSGSRTVEKWLDVRETSTSEPYAYMRAEHDFTHYSEGPRSRKPTRVQGVSDVNGLPMVDFGTFGATDTTAAWLPWRMADGTRGVLTTIRAVFAVAAFPDSNGFFVEDWDYTDAGGETNTVGTQYFWLGSEVLSKKCFCLFETTCEAYKSAVYLNGIRVDAGTRAPEALGQVMEVMTMIPVTAANFFNGRNIDGYWGTFPHIGGGRLGEVLVYTNELTEAERLGIESYLQRKWKKGGQVGTHRVGLDATLITAVDAGETNKIGAVSGEGLWRKTGPGTVSLGNEPDLMLGPIQLEGGTLADDGYVRRPNRLFAVPESGLSVRAETDRWEIVSTAVSNALLKTGAGELTVTGFPRSATQVAVNGGTLRLTQTLRGSGRTAPVAIYNNSFEIFDNHDNHGPASDPNNVWGYMPTGMGWKEFGVVSPTEEANAVGVYKANCSDASWCVQQPAPDGEWVAFIKQGGGWRTTFTVPTEGRYRLVFDTACRGGGGNKHRYNILIDGDVIAHVRTNQRLFKRSAFALPQLAEGNHTLTFQGIDEGVDRASLIDDVRIEWEGASGQIEGMVTNGSFEVSGPLTDGLWDWDKDLGGYAFTYLVADSGWTFGPVQYGGITEDYSPWMFQLGAVEGRRAAYIRETGFMYTTVSFPTNGLYELSFLTAGRRWGQADEADNGHHDYRIKLDDEQIATRFVYKKYFERVTVRLPAITNAPVSKELRFEGINTLGGDRTSLIDDVHVTRLADGNPVADSGFEVPAGTLANGGDNWEAGVTLTAWAFDRGDNGYDRISGIARNGGDWPLPIAPEGTCAAFLQKDSKMSQAVTFAEDGYYTLSFMAAARIRALPEYYLHDFKILFNGEQVGYVQTFDDTWRRYTFRLPYAKAGVADTLLFQSVNSMAYQWGMGEDHVSFIDDVRIEKQAVAGGSGTAGVCKDTVVHLAAGSTGWRSTSRDK